MAWLDAFSLDIPYVDEPEQIDALTLPYTDIAQAMRDVALSNRLFGGTQTVLHHAAQLLRDVPSGTSLRVLDIGTGSADIPRALAAWGRKRGLEITIVGVDNHEQMITLARESAPGIHLVKADALRLPFAPRSFDLALCALAFHHFGFQASARVLAAMDALTTRGFVVSDLRRDLLTLRGVQATFAVLGAHPITKHDGPASVRRAWTVPEYRKMVGLSGVSGVRVYTPWYFRVALVQEKLVQDKLAQDKKG